jgi:hypothetical protein
LRFKNLIVFIITGIVPIPCIFWLPEGEVLAHGLIFPWPAGSGLWEFISNYHLSIWVFGPNYDFSSSIFYSYAAILASIGISVNTVQIFFLYFGYLGCIVGMFLLARMLGFTSMAALISGVLYLLSPAVFSGMPVEIVNLRILPYYIATPFLLVVTIKIFNSKEYAWYLALLGLVSFLLCVPSYSSLQYFVLHFILLSGFIIFHTITNLANRLILIENSKKAFWSFVVILASNFFWVFPFIAGLQDSYTARAEPGMNDTEILRALSVKLIDGFRMLPYPAQASISPWIAYYYTPIMTAIVFLFAGVGIFSFLRKETRCMALFPGTLLVLILFLGKGVLPPFSDFGNVIFLSMPYATRLFRNPGYFNSLAVFLFPLLIGLGMGEIIRIAKLRGTMHFIITSVSISLLLVVYGWQFIIGGPINSQPSTSNAQAVKVPQYFADIASQLKEEKLIYRNLEVPLFTTKASFSAFDWGKTYLGVAPFVVWSGKVFLSPFVNGKVEAVLDESNHPQKEKISYATWLKVLQFANVRHVVHFKDTAWDFLKKRDLEFGVSREDVENFLADNPFAVETAKFGKIELRTLDKNYFLPVFYTPESIVWSQAPFETMREAGSKELLNTRSVIFSNEQNIGSAGKTISLHSKITNLPVLEFNRSRLTKYRVRVHGAGETFPLVFSDGFHPGWKVYLGGITNALSGKQEGAEVLQNYKVLDGNAEDQATNDDVEIFISKGWVTAFGDGRDKRIKHWKLTDGKEKLDYTEKIKIDFISKNFQDTIQNNNLPSGFFWETWFEKPLAEDNHLTANGYANAWLIETAKLCGESPSACVKNSDGTYDLELVVEFWPQRLLYFGLFVSGFTLFACLSYLLGVFIKRRRKIAFLLAASRSN